MTWLLALACTAPDANSDAPWTWEQTWADEFDVDGSPDPENWAYDIGGHGWGNEQLEYNTDRPENVRVKDGFLVINALQEDYEGNAWTSARIKTQGLFSQEQGRFEARIQLPPGRGIWPAFWMLGDNFESAGWPDCGEIDILEARGAEPYTTNAALHGPGYSGGSSLYDALTVEDDLQDASHIYAVEWDQDHIAWFLDDQLVQKVHAGQVGTWVFDHEFFMILNVAVGGTYGGPPDDSTPSDSRMFVDYVRVYQRVVE
ncbi:MAG: glycoside hydrolase family 16 protein [Myxococcota bacterium]|nr:glycoside hydrolase family 16 protein [Myxococcota bacterium]